MRRGAVSPGTAFGKSHDQPSSPDGSSSVASTLLQTDSRPTSGRRADESILEEEQDTGGRGYAHGLRGRFETFGAQDGRWEEVEGLLVKLNSLGISISRFGAFLRPGWRQLKGKTIVSSVNSHKNATSER